MNINEVRLSTAIISVSLQLGYTELKPCQESAVKSFVSGKDVFVSVPINPAQQTDRNARCHSVDSIISDHFDTSIRWVT